MGTTVTIKFPQVVKLAVMKTFWDDTKKEITAQFSIVCVVHPGDTSRVINLLKQGVPLFITIGSDQAEFDMTFEDVNFQEQLTKGMASGTVKVVSENKLPGASPASTTLDKQPLTPDLSTFSIEVGTKDKPHIAKLMGKETRSPYLKEVILLAFAACGIDAHSPAELVDILRKYPPTTQRDLIIDIFTNELSEDEMAKLLATKLAATAGPGKPKNKRGPSKSAQKRLKAQEGETSAGKDDGEEGSTDEQQ